MHTEGGGSDGGDGWGDGGGGWGGGGGGGEMTEGHHGSTVVHGHEGGGTVVQGHGGGANGAVVHTEVHTEVGGTL